MMPHTSPRRVNRRVFLARSTLAYVSTSVAYTCWAAGGNHVNANDKNDRPKVALIGAGWQPDKRRRGRGLEIGKQATAHADLVAICEVDSVAAKFAHQTLTQGRCELLSDYRQIIDRDDIDAVLIATPDHWHAKIAIEAMRSGKDVYCEKPASLTIDEGIQMRAAVKETGRVMQIGTQQRSEYNSRFLTAIAMVRDGRLGKLQRIRIGLGPGWRGGPFQASSPPPTLDWNQWLGPAPMADYRPERTHRTFRWWYEYAGGQLADWGAHHVDIAQWAIGHDNHGPISVTATGDLNQPLNNGMPTRADMYNTPVGFSVRCVFPANPNVVASDGDTIEMLIDDGRNGIIFEGDRGRFFVNRATLEGTLVDELAEQPLPADAIEKLTGSSDRVSHMQNFFDCMRSRQTPIAPIESHHRTISTCHLANLSVRLGRELKWDAKNEQFIGDEMANSMLSRHSRSGFEIEGNHS
ncbi:Gfo/Idh/MocA family protein [Neorhodopirellula pilleata]|uniref:Glucose--fructose oxidoreductase n=1 Tax=Neorhodopirellula pilleata TaxID=2714738 RepID=A0A5C5ZZM4_9BACT|nr:Gfo/Idh/MocA family oxidoreductase [Neorhodopirellula pilleata]TWT93024.1 Glucose--fructose oxidoreductase precursor [Neorhodopirellula pilleata]